MNTIHHLISRIAHRVHFLKEEERNDFIEMMRRSAEFSGIQLIGWCIMINHFHILIHLPPPEPVDESEIIRRLGVLKGKNGAITFEHWISSERQKGELGEKNVQQALDRLRRRMYDVGEFMKTLKQWFTEEYNRRNSHVGTLWESTYHDRLVPYEKTAMSRVLCYIHLNPIRAAACAGFDDYVWSSLNAAVRQDKVAMDGLKFVYGAEGADSDIIATHHLAMSDVLEYEKCKRAEEIARRRMAGYDIPPDPLTDEAYVAQATFHLQKVIDAGVALTEERMVYAKCAEKQSLLEQQILSLIKSDPRINILQMSKQLDASSATVNRCVNSMCKRGMIFREKRNSPWLIN